MAQAVKRLPEMQETRVRFLGWEDPLEKETATRSSTLFQKIPWMKEPDGLESTGSQRVGQDRATSPSLLLSGSNTSMLFFRTYLLNIGYIARKNKAFHSAVLNSGLLSRG